jgi:pilus assembly protein CpaB
LKRSNRLILLIGVFLAALAFVFIIVILSSPSNVPGTGSNPSAPPAKIQTVVAAKDIPLGITIRKEMLTTQLLAPEARKPGSYVDPSAVIGQVARATILTGQQVSLTDFIEQAGLNFQCPAGFDCVAVQVDQVSGVGTLIKTGDFVDMVAAVSTGDSKFPVLDPLTNALVPPGNYDHTSVKTLIQSIQVVSTLLPPPPTAETGTATPAPAPAAGGATALNGQQEIVILALTTQQAEVVKFAQMDGSITLALRSPKDFVDASGNPIIPDAAKTTGIILSTLIKDYQVLPPEQVFTVHPSARP